VRAENLVHGSDQLSCPFGALGVMISGHVSAVRVPPGYAGRRRVAAVAAGGDPEDRRDLDPAPPAQRAAAPAAAAGEAGLSAPVRCPARRHAERSAPAAVAAGHPGHDRALAPRHRPPPPGRPVRARQDRPASDPPEHPGTRPGGWLARTPAEGTAGLMVSSPVSGLTSQRPPSGKSSGPAASTPADSRPGRPGHKSCAPANGPLSRSVTSSWTLTSKRAGRGS
jgi:hypothetical protein